MVNKPLLRPAIPGGGTWPGGGRLTSHKKSDFNPDNLQLISYFQLLPSVTLWSPKWRSPIITPWKGHEWINPTPTTARRAELVPGSWKLGPKFPRNFTVHFSGQIFIFHQTRFPWNSRGPVSLPTKHPLGDPVRYNLTRCLYVLLWVSFISKRRNVSSWSHMMGWSESWLVRSSTPHLVGWSSIAQFMRKMVMK